MVPSAPVIGGRTKGQMGPIADSVGPYARRYVLSVNGHVRQIDRSSLGEDIPFDWGDSSTHGCPRQSGEGPTKSDTTIWLLLSLVI